MNRIEMEMDNAAVILRPELHSLVEEGCSSAKVGTVVQSLITLK
jgi:hypothetical protein